LDGNLTCREGDVITIRLEADLQNGANSDRSDIGIWISTNGADAKTGTSCNHFYFPTTVGIGVAPFLDLDGPAGRGADQCGDLEGSQSLFDISLRNYNGTVAEIEVICQDLVTIGDNKQGDPDVIGGPDGKADVGACTSWEIPGPNTANDCLAADPRLGTAPSAGSKCRCVPLSIANIRVEKNAYIEVIKHLTPIGSGTFDLYIKDSTDTVVGSATDVGDGGTTTKVEVNAGVVGDPALSYTVGEDPDSGYTTTTICVERGTGTTVTSGTNNATFPVAFDDDIVCTNERANRCTRAICCEVFRNEQPVGARNSDLQLPRHQHGQRDLDRRVAQ
jgi:hypothetical protein